MKLRAFVTNAAASLCLACQSDDSICVPGRQIACPCLRGAQGVQVCNDEGSAYGSCTCPAASSAAYSPWPADAGRADTAADSGARTAPGNISIGGLFQPAPITKRLAARQDHPTGLAVYGSRVYWAREGDGTIVGCDAAHCDEADPVVLVRGLHKPRDIAVDAQALYWIEAGVDGKHLTVSRCPRAGCEGEDPSRLFEAEALGHGLAVDKEHLYIGAWDELLRCPLAGCRDADPQTLARAGGISGVAVSAGQLYFVRAETRQLWRCPVAGCGAEEADAMLLGSDRFPLSLTTDARFVYWTDYDFYALRASDEAPALDYCPAAGCTQSTPARLAVGGIAPWGVALDAQAIYWSDYEKGQIVQTARPWGR